MKTRLLFTIALMSTFYISAQTDGWRLFTKASTITEIVPDDTNADELHITTDIGYMKYNTTSDLVTDFLNLTSQDPAIGKVNGISLDPTSNDIALAIPNGLAIYNGTTVTISNYDNSDLTVGSSGGSPFVPLEVSYGRAGELYVYKPDVTGYQIFDTGVFDAEVATTFKPQDIVENLAGTMVYFAGFNDGLHELTKATTTWTNYTSTNSDLIYNPLESLHVDANNLLYIGSFQGLNTMTSAGSWNSYQQLAPPANTSFYPVYDISRNGTTGDLLIRTSKPNTSYFGFTLLDLSTNTWTNYRGDATNCIDNNVLTASVLDSNGSIFVAPLDTSNPGVLTSFNPFTDNCTSLNINYLNAPLALNSNVVTDFNIREKANGNLDIGFTRTNDLHIIEVTPTTFNGVFPNATTLTPSPGNYAGSVINDNNFFFVDNDDGFVFIDDSNNMTSFSHNIPDYLAINTKKTSVFDSGSGIFNIIHKGFDALFNYRVYKTQCNTGTGTCLPSEEIFTNNRDLTQNIIFGATEDPITNKVDVVAIKTDNSGNIKRTSESWESAQPAVSNWDRIHDVFPRFDPVVFSFVVDDLVNITSLFAPPEETILNIREDGSDGSTASNDFTNDSNNDGVNDELAAVNKGVITESDGNVIAKAFHLWSIVNTNGWSSSYENLSNVSDDSNRNASSHQTVPIPDASINNELPIDLFVKRVKFNQYSPTEAFMVILTNYGVLVKSGIDISGITLGLEDLNLKDIGTTLYPNPSNDVVFFSDTAIKQIEVFDINGRKVLNTEANSISVKSLSKGIYIVKGITTENLSITRKLIKN